MASDVSSKQSHTDLTNVFILGAPSVTFTHLDDELRGAAPEEGQLVDPDAVGVARHLRPQVLAHHAEQRVKRAHALVAVPVAEVLLKKEEKGDMFFSSFEGCRARL